MKSFALPLTVAGLNETGAGQVQGLGCGTRGVDTSHSLALVGLGGMGGLALAWGGAGKTGSGWGVWPWHGG